MLLWHQKKIANLKIKNDLDYCYDLNYDISADEKYPSQLKDLKSKLNYYLYLKLKYLQYANLTLLMNKISFQTFNNVSILYYEDKSNAFPKK